MLTVNKGDGAQQHDTSEPVSPGLEGLKRRFLLRVFAGLGRTSPAAVGGFSVRSTAVDMSFPQRAAATVTDRRHVRGIDGHVTKHTRK